MDISIFGLGYVGTVSAACLAKQGHQVLGVDIDSQKVNLINACKSPVVEQDIEEMIAGSVSAGGLRATGDSAEALSNSAVSIICVGTPSRGNGSIDLTFVERVLHDIGVSLARKDRYHVIILRSTVLPGTTEEFVLPILERVSGKVAGRDFGVCFNPEFLREGTSVQDFYNPPFTVIGQHDPRTVEIVSELYGFLSAPLFVVPLKTAEIIKYASNAFHALKVTFANEIGSICKNQGIDSHQVMKIFCADTKLNLSPYYLRPAFAFGGSCLPKDLRAILYHSRRLDLHLPVLEAIIPSNDLQIQRGYEMIKKTGKNRIGLLGLSFKAGTDDLRESPLVVLIETLIGKGMDVRIYDQNVSIGRLRGANRDYIEGAIPHIAALLQDSIDDVVNKSDVLVIGNHSKEFLSAVVQARPDQSVVDLVGLSKEADGLMVPIDGICW